MKNTIIAVGLMMVFAGVLPATTWAAPVANTTKASTESDCAHFSILRKQEQLAKLETELVKVKRRSPRRQYTAGIESHMSMLRFELLELQKLQQRR